MQTTAQRDACCLLQGRVEIDVVRASEARAQAASTVGASHAVQAAVGDGNHKASAFASAAQSIAFF